MVDPVLGEQNSVDVEVKVDDKSNRRRVVRKPRKPKKDTIQGVEVQKVAEEKQESNNRRLQQRRPKQRAPRVGTSENNEVRERADYTDGTLHLKISSTRPRTIYTRLARLMLAGYDGSGNVLEGLKKPIDVVEVSALGNAITSAIFVADNLIKAQVVEQVDARVDFVNFDNTDSSNERTRGSARLVLTLRRLESWDAKKDEVLNKTRVFRTKVLGLPDQSTSRTNTSA